MKIMKNLKI